MSRYTILQSILTKSLRNKMFHLRSKKYLQFKTLYIVFYNVKLKLFPVKINGIILRKIPTKYIGLGLFFLFFIKKIDKNTLII
jgi:hypothetical protein